MKFVTPEIEVKKFAVEDILTASGATVATTATTESFCNGDCPVEGELDF